MKSEAYLSGYNAGRNYLPTINPNHPPTIQRIEREDGFSAGKRCAINPNHPTTIQWIEWEDGFSAGKRCAVQGY